MPRRRFKRQTPETNFTADSVGPQPGCGGARDIRPWKSAGQNRLMKKSLTVSGEGSTIRRYPMPTPVSL